MTYSFNDFIEDPAWLVFRIDTEINKQPVDIYMTMDLPSGEIIAFEIVETELSQAQANLLLALTKEKKKTLPKRIILAKNDPAEGFLQKSAKNMHIGFEAVPAEYLNELTAELKQSFGEQFLSPSSLGFSYLKEDVDELERESVKRMLPDSYDLCSCASGNKYKFCCKKIFFEIVEAMVAAEDGKIQKALEWINRAKLIVGETAEVLCRESIVYSYFDVEKSDSILKQCLSVNPKHPRAHYLLGLKLKSQGDFHGAILAYETAIANYPQSDHYHLNETYNNLGSVFYKIGDMVKAKLSWEKALLFLPSDKTVRRNLSECIYNQPIAS
jgi:tetratricopeptide (TPR) repeat protein